MQGRHEIEVNLEPFEVYQRLSAGVAQSYWFDVLNAMFVRTAMVGFLGVNHSTIWANKFARSANLARLKIVVESCGNGSRISYEIKRPFLADVWGNSDEDIPMLSALVPRLFEASLQSKARGASLPDE